MGYYNDSGRSNRGFGGRSGGRRDGRSRKNEYGIGHGQPGANLRPINWATTSLRPFRKDFYTDPMIHDQQTVLNYRSEKTITVIGDGIPQPILTFQQANFPPSIMNQIHEAGFPSPTPIQAQGWPMALSGRDVVGIAQTGSGKTLAFVLPGFVHILAQEPLSRGDGPIALVVAPTRELAMQIETEAQTFARGLGLKIGSVYGGASKWPQKNMLRDGVDMLVCTPGRMLDFLENDATNCQRVTYLVFDEADRMLDMGFENQIRLLVSQIRPDRQVLLWSATWPKEIRRMASDFLRDDFIQLKVGSDEGVACERVAQTCLVMSSYQKQPHLEDTLRQYSGRKVLVFVGTKRMCDQLSRDLNRKGMYTNAIHGDKDQRTRTRTLADFKDGRTRILLATDVAARGIHIDDIALVVNYDFPQCCDDYIHRIGRTGRAGSFGTAITYFDPKTDSGKTNKFIKILTDANQTVPEELMRLRGSSSYGGRRNGRSRFGGNRRGGRGGSRRFGAY